MDAKPVLLRLTLLSSLGLAVAGSCLAALPSPTGEGETMQAWWGGLRAADIAFTAELADGAYRGHLTIRTRGMVHWLTGLDLDAEGSGKMTAGGPIPERFEQTTISRRGERVVQLGFVGPVAQVLADRETLASTAEPDPEPEDATPLPEALRKDVLDPVAAILALGRRAKAGERSFAVAVFDGRKRYDLAVTSQGQASHNIAGKVFDTIDLRVVIHPLHGFKPRHLAMWQDARFDVFIGRDDGLPLKVDTSSFVAGALVNVQGLCPPAACDLPPRS